MTHVPLHSCAATFFSLSTIFEGGIPPRDVDTKVQFDGIVSFVDERCSSSVYRRVSTLKRFLRYFREKRSRISSSDDATNSSNEWFHAYIIQRLQKRTTYVWKGFTPRIKRCVLTAIERFA